VPEPRPSIQLRDREKQEDEAVFEALEEAERADVDRCTRDEQVEITCTPRIIATRAKPRCQARPHGDSDDRCPTDEEPLPSEWPQVHAVCRKQIRSPSAEGLDPVRVIRKLRHDAVDLVNRSKGREGIDAECRNDEGEHVPPAATAQPEQHD
jgi:hypothetical protein